MKYKIQEACLYGWSDLKYTKNDGKTWIPDLYRTKKEAERELADLKEGLSDYEGRVVPANTPEDWDQY